MITTIDHPQIEVGFSLKYWKRVDGVCTTLLAHGMPVVTVTMAMVMINMKMMREMVSTCSPCSSLLAQGKHMDWKHLKSATSPPNPVTAAQSESVTQAGKALMSLV